MRRKLLLFVLLGTLTVPRPALGQERRADAASGEGDVAGVVEAEVFRKALEEIAARHRQAFSDSALWSLALDGLLESLNDPYADVFTPTEVEAFDEENTGNYTGIGVQITELNGQVTVTKVFPGTPADVVGVLEGDVIVGVDESDAREWTTDIVADSIRGPAETDVRVVVSRSGFDQPIPLRITRAEVHVPAVRADLMSGDIGYIQIDRVARNSATEVDSVLREMPSAKGLVVDLRRNPGGLFDESLMMADVFLDRGKTLASLETRAVGGNGETSRDSWNARFPVRVPDVPIVVLVDEYTASAAEIVAGALQDHDRALVIGNRTFGKGVVQTVVPLPYGHRLRLTTGTWATPLGRSLHRPRRADGRPLEEDLDTFPRVRTPTGRSLYAAGGIFPDLRVAPDSLRAAERELLQTAADEGVPLGVRLQEFGFERAQALRTAGRRATLGDAQLDELIERLETDGLPESVLRDPVARGYLAWRARVTIADRMDDLGASAEFRMERDPVLAEAVRLLRTSPTQLQLFSHAKRAKDAKEAEGSGGGALH